MSDARRMLAPADLLDRFEGIAHGRRLQEFGCSRTQLSAAVRTGSIRRLRPGVFVLATAAPKVVTAGAHGGALTCADALRAHGVWVLPGEDESVHVWMGGSGRRHPHADCECTAHYSAGTARLGLAPVVVALIHAYRCLTAEAFFAAYESAWNKRLLSARDRARIRRELPSAAHWLLDLARSDSQSGLESLLRLRLHLIGVHLECQIAIDGVGRVDFVVGGRLILEVDGRVNHVSAERRHRDLERDAAASALGFETLRFDYAMVVHDWPSVVQAILPALDRARS